MYKVVEFVDDDDSCEIIQDRWMIGNHAAYFPPLNKYLSYIKNIKTDLKVIQKWKVSKANILHDNIVSFEAAREITKHLSEFGNTENEERLKVQRLKKRRHPVNYLGEGSHLDLRQHVKKLKKINEKPEEHNYPITAVQQNVSPKDDVKAGILSDLANVSGDLTDSTRNQVGMTGIQADMTSEESETENELKILSQRSISDTQVEFSTADSNVTILIEVEKLLQKFKREIVEEIKNEILVELKKEILSALSATTSNVHVNAAFKKITSTQELEQFVEEMRDPETKRNMVATLNMLHDSSGCYKKVNGKVATMASFLFTKEYIKEQLTWGDMNGRPSGKTCLNDYPTFFELIVSALKNSDDFSSIKNEEIKIAFQDFFKYKVKKL